MNSSRISQARVLCPASDAQPAIDAVMDVVIEGERIAAMGDAASRMPVAQEIDARGLWLVPGAIDLCARLRESGRAQAGRLESEASAAARAGVSTLVCPPDTEPVLDEPGLVQMLHHRAAQAVLGPDAAVASRIVPQAALTRALAGEALTEMAALMTAGCVALSQADRPIHNTQVLQRALQYAGSHGIAVWLRPEDPRLAGGVAASGPQAMRMGLAGIPVAAETIAIYTLLELVRSTGTRVHLCRLSSARGLALVRQAKQEGLPVTCDVSVQSLHLSDAALADFDSRARLVPPLRSAQDRQALRAGLADGTIDALVSDHTPVDDDAKALPFAEAEPGASAVELLWSLALLWAEADGVPALRAVEVLTRGPASVLAAGLIALPDRLRTRWHEDLTSLGGLSVGAVADLCLIDPKAHWQVEGRALYSRGKHTPFEGQRLPGVVRQAWVAGQAVRT